jgi:hypothetical protein
MISLTNEQESVIRWYVNMLHSYEANHNEWAKSNKQQWIDTMYNSFLINDETTLKSRYDRIIKLYNQKDEPTFIFPFFDLLNNELEHLYKS